jgi:hypothetical protein
MTVNIDTLLGQAFGVEEVELPDLGTVKVRPLTRAEALELRGVELDVAQMEQRLLSLAMVEPTMTEAQVARWQAVSPAGQLEPVSNAIIRLSGMEKAAQRAAYDEFRGQSGS